MFRITRLLKTIASIGHGLAVFFFLLLLAVFIRQADLMIKNSIVTSALSTIFFPAQYIIASIDDYYGKSSENEKLKRENAELRVELYRAKEGLKELSRLHELVRFEDTWDYPIVTARVVGRNPGRFLTTFVINRGKHHGLKEEMPVFSMRGLVGKISKVEWKHATVQLLVDPNLKLSVMEKRTRAVGILEFVNGRNLSAMIPTNAGVKMGDTLITSGLGGIYPKGIEVGVVNDIHKSDLEVMRNMEVLPFQEFSLLEEVFVMQKEPDWIVREMLK